jgi:hypothetical protein
MKFFILLAFLSFNVFAIDWTELEAGKNYKLTQNFQLPQLERSGSLLDFSKGDELLLNEIIPLDMINVMLYEFAYKKCPGQDMKTDMEIIPVQGTTPVIEVGAQLEKCTLSIYIETKDINTQSFIE